MPFTAAEIENAANAAIDYHAERGTLWSSGIQNKPLFAAMWDKSKPFPGGKGLVTERVTGSYDDDFVQGFESDDDVDYDNPTGIKTASMPYRLHHSGIKFTMHELIIDGISVTETSNGGSTSMHSEREMTALTGLLEHKVEFQQESNAKSYNKLMWLPGTADPKKFAGIQNFIVDNPTASTYVAGIDPVANTWWRNRARTVTSTGGAINAATPANQVLVQVLQNEFRQLRRYGDPKHLWLGGSDFLDAFEAELRAKGNYTLTGWAKSDGQTIDASVADVSFKGVTLKYDPTLDDLGLAKYSYVIDTKAIRMRHVEGEQMKKHSPARPENRYVFYRANTFVGCMTCRQRNTSGVYAIV